MSIFGICILIITLKNIQSDKIFFQCTLDKNESCRLRPFDNGTELIVNSGNGILSSDKPIQPWSDVSSIFQPTKNGYQCQIPYKKESNSNDLYFCYKSLDSMKCQTTNGFEDECQQGKYQILLLENIEKRVFITPKINSFPNSICLTFYYYITKADNIILLTHYLNEEGERKLIGTFNNVPYNGWHLAQESFKQNSTSYHIIFEISRIDMSNPSQPVYVAFDQISVTEGNCESILPSDEFINDNQLFLMRSFDDTTLDSSSSDTTFPSAATTDSILNTEQSTESSTSIGIDTSSNLVTNENENLTTGSHTIIEMISIQTTENQYIENNTYITTTRDDKTTTAPPPTEKSPLLYSFTTVLGLSIGLGIPAALGVIGGLIYLIKLIRKPKKTIVMPIEQPRKHHQHRHRSNKQTDIELKKQPHRQHHHRHHEKKTNKTKEDIV